MRTASAPISCLSSRLTKAFPTLHTERGQRSPYSSCINKDDLFVYYFSFFFIFFLILNRIRSYIVSQIVKSLLVFLLKLMGQCQEIFDFRFLSWISFSQAPGIPLGPYRNFFENLRSYSQLKVHHWCRWLRWQIEKIFHQKSFKSFVWTPSGGRVIIQIHFFLQVHFKV